MDNLSKVTLHRVDEQDGVDEYEVTLYEYDGRGLQTKVVDALGNVTVHQYDGNGNLVKTTDADGYVTEYTMDALDLIEHINYNGGKQVDLLHQITATTDRLGKHVAYTYDGVGNQTSVAYPDGTTAAKEYGKLNGNPNGQKRQTVAEYVYDETNKMVEGTNSIGESSSYLFNGKNALVEQTWHIAKNGYGYHDVDATEEDLTAIADLARGKGGNGSGGNGHGNGNGQGNGNGAGDKPTGTTVGSFSTVVKQFVIDYTVETMDPLMEHEVNGLDYRYVYGNERLSVNISPIENGAGHVVESGTVGQQIRLYYHQDLRGTVDYLTSPVSQKVESWTHYNEWGEITHNAVLKMGQRELDLVKNYTGHDFDAVLNMYYAKARMYDAENRRFVALDPIMDGSRYDISERVTDPTMFVQYLYVKNMPLIAVDPLGLYYIDDVGISDDTNLLYKAIKENVWTEGNIWFGAITTGSLAVAKDAYTNSHFYGGTSMYYATDEEIFLDLFSSIATQGGGNAIQALFPSVGSSFNRIVDIATVAGEVKSSRTVNDYDKVIFEIFDLIGYKPYSNSVSEIENVMSAMYSFVDENYTYFFGRYYSILFCPGYTNGFNVSTTADTFWKEDLSILNSWSPENKINSLAKELNNSMPYYRSGLSPELDDFEYRMEVWNNYRPHLNKYNERIDALKENVKELILSLDPDFGGQGILKKK